MRAVIALSLICTVGCLSGSTIDTAIQTIKADITTINAVYDTATAWIDVNGALLTPKIIERIKQIRAQYDTSYKAVQDLLAAYDAKKHDDLMNTYRLLASAILELIQLVKTIGGPATLSRSLPISAFHAVIADSKVRYESSLVR
jgi:hypothetical protein